MMCSDIIHATRAQETNCVSMVQVLQSYEFENFILFICTVISFPMGPDSRSSKPLLCIYSYVCNRIHCCGHRLHTHTSVPPALDVPGSATVRAAGRVVRVRVSAGSRVRDRCFIQAGLRWHHCRRLFRTSDIQQDEHKQWHTCVALCCSENFSGRSEYSHDSFLDIDSHAHSV